MKYAVAVLALIVVLLLIDRRRVSDQPTTLATRDSVRVIRVVDSIRHDSVVLKYVRLPVDTVALVLRALARRPPLVTRDTLWLPPPDSAGDTGVVTLSRAEGIRLAIRDTSHVLVQDSLRGDLAVCRAELDSARGYRSHNRGYAWAFGAGYVTGTVVGLGVCAIVK